MNKSLFAGILIAMMSFNCIKAQTDTTFSEKTPLVQYVRWNIPYHQTLTMKILLAGAAHPGNNNRFDVGFGEVKLNCEQALDVIRRVDNLTLGIPKIVYLVGWQYNGHDSKYPAWFEGNERIRRPEDANALESIKWLMKEARKYHTIVSLHINMVDAYEDSPLWNTYLQNDIVAKNKDGSLRLATFGYPISYAQEWKTGYARKRIDSLCKLLPLKEAGTIHVDAFVTWSPVYPGQPLSPYLDYTIDDETEAQRKIFLYWASKGIDVTSESMQSWRKSWFEGYQPFAWWFYGSLQQYMKWPASYYCGGVDESEWGKLFGTSMHGEDLIAGDAKLLTGFSGQFLTKTAVWYYLNRLDRRYYLKNADFQAVQFSHNVRSYLAKDKYLIAKDDMVLVEDSDVFVPALWMEKPSIVAYSGNGYSDRKWLLPEAWKDINKVDIFEITMEGTRLVESNKPVIDRKLNLSLKKDMAVLINQTLINNHCCPVKL